MKIIFQEGLYSWLGQNTVLGEMPKTLTAVFLAFYILMMVVPYLLGSISPAILLSRYVFHDDIRTHGSGNAGSTNMYRVFGARGAVPTVLLDILKAACSLLFAAFLFGFWYAGSFSHQPRIYIAAAFCIIGHIYPIYYRFHGGKGVLCTAVAVFILNPWVAAILLLVFVILVAFTRYVSLGSCVAAGLYPVFLIPIFRAVFSGADSAPAELVVFAFFVAIIIIWAHRANLSRLMRHEEPKFRFRRSGD